MTVTEMRMFILMFKIMFLIFTDLLYWLSVINSTNVGPNCVNVNCVNVKIGKRATPTGNLKCIYKTFKAKDNKILKDERSH